MKLLNLLSALLLSIIAVCKAGNLDVCVWNWHNEVTWTNTNNARSIVTDPYITYMCLDKYCTTDKAYKNCRYCCNRMKNFIKSEGFNIKTLTMNQCGSC